MILEVVGDLSEWGNVKSCSNCVCVCYEAGVSSTGKDAFFVLVKGETSGPPGVGKGKPSGKGESRLQIGVSSVRFSRLH